MCADPNTYPGWTVGVFFSLCTRINSIAGVIWFVLLSTCHSSEHGDNDFMFCIVSLTGIATVELHCCYSDSKETATGRITQNTDCGRDFPQALLSGIDKHAVYIRARQVQTGL